MPFINRNPDPKKILLTNVIFNNFQFKKWSIINFNIYIFCENMPDITQQASKKKHMMPLEKRITWQGSDQVMLGPTKRKKDPSTSSRPQIGSVRQDSTSQLQGEAP